MQILFPFFSFFANNKAAQWIAGIVSIVLLWKGREWHIKREARREGAEDVIEQIEEQTNERIEAAEEAGRTTADLNAQQLRDLASKSSNNAGRVQRSTGD